MPPADGGRYPSDRETRSRRLPLGVGLPGRVWASAQAVWLDAGTIVWPGADATHGYKLYSSANGALAAGVSDISGNDNPGGVPLAVGALSAAQQGAYPQYASAIALMVPAGTDGSTLLRDQLAVVQYSGSTPTNGTPRSLASLQ